MRIEFRESVDTYDDLTKIISNQLEILEELTSGITNLVNLESFKGEAAKRIKSYFGEVHMLVINTLKVMLMEFDTKLYAMNEDFKSNVDKGYTPILDTEYLSSKIDKMKIDSEDFKTVENSLNSVLLGVSDIFTSQQDNTYGTKAITGFEDSITYVDKLITALVTFNSNHENDMVSLQDATNKLKLTFAYMESISKPNGTDYNSQSIDDLQWAKDLREYQFTTSEKLVTSKESVTEDYIKVMIGMNMPIGLFGKVADPSFTIKEALTLYKAGMKYKLIKDGNKVYYKLTSEITDVAQLQAKLKSMGLPQLKYTKIRQMITNGIEVVDNKNIVNRKIIDALKSSKGFRPGYNDIMKESDEVVKLGKFGKLLKGIEIVGTAVTVYQDTKDNVYNSKTGEWDITNLDKSSDAAIDAGVDIGTDLLAGAIVQCIFPVPGVGFALGCLGAAAITTGLQFLKWGEPPKTVFDNTKDFAKDTKNEVGQWMSKVFW